jgi:two-component system nitrate/nitrite sensor histidine kinase NarX
MIANHHNAFSIKMRFMRELYRKIKLTLEARWIPWLIVGIAISIALLREILQFPIFKAMSASGQVVFWVCALFLVGLISLLLARLNELYEQRDQLKAQLQGAESLVSEAYQRLEALFHVTQKFVEASDENEVVEPLLQMIVNLTGADGAAFVPLDEHGQPQSSFNFGSVPSPAVDDWLEYLASPRVREKCRICEEPDHLEKQSSCPLLQAPFEDTAGLFCLPVKRGEREYGVVTLFVSDLERVDARTRIYLRALIDETALGLESIHMRRRELAALRGMQSLRERTDLKALLNGLLGNVHRTLEADFAVMHVARGYPAGLETPVSEIELTAGVFPQQARLFINGILQGVIASREPVLLGDVAGDPFSPPGLRSLIAVPLLLPEGSALGVIVVGNRNSRSFSQRQLSLLQTIAGQVALVVQNAGLMAELEYKTMIDERARLAREIHDGLAQTLGFLKLQMAQMRGQLGRGELDRVHQIIDQSYLTLSEAYEDARQAIDGLRISPTEVGLHGWLEQTIQDFQEVSKIPVEFQEENVHLNLPAEIHVQLIRIVQEAFSNIRKHGQASRVWFEYRETQEEITIEIRDDGIGFFPEDVSHSSRHGLRGMRERAELIGADIQVISRPQEGTIVRLILSLENLSEVVS